MSLIIKIVFWEMWLSAGFAYLRSFRKNLVKIYLGDCVKKSTNQFQKDLVRERKKVDMTSTLLLALPIIIIVQCYFCFLFIGIMWQWKFVGKCFFWI